MQDTLQQRYEEFLDPRILQPRLIAASIFIAGYESLKDSIIDRARSLYWCGFDESGDIFNPRYQSEVLSRNKSPVYASLDWLRSNNAITQDDIVIFDGVKKTRNLLAHKLFTALWDGLPKEFELRFEEMTALLRKIEVWWIRNFDLPDELEESDIPDEEISPGRCIGLSLLCNIALSGPEEGTKFIEKFRKRTAPTQPH